MRFSPHASQERGIPKQETDPTDTSRLCDGREQPERRTDHPTPVGDRQSPRGPRYAPLPRKWERDSSSGDIDPFMHLSPDAMGRRTIPPRRPDDLDVFLFIRCPKEPSRSPGAAFRLGCTGMRRSSPGSTASRSCRRISASDTTALTEMVLAPCREREAARGDANAPRE